MQHVIRGSDVFVKEDLRAMLGGLQATAAHYPPGDFAAGFLAALASMRAMLDLPATLADLPDLPPAVRVLPVERQQLGAPTVPGARQFKITGEIEHWGGLSVADDAPPLLQVSAPPAVVDAPPAGWRKLQPAAVVPVDVAESDRVVEVERGDDPIVVNPQYWRLIHAGDQGFVYDEIGGPGRLVLPAARWVPVPLGWRDRIGVTLVADHWALFVTIEWAIRQVGSQRIARLPDGRAQLTGR